MQTYPLLLLPLGWFPANNPIEAVYIPQPPTLIKFNVKEGRLSLIVKLAKIDTINALVTTDR